jgi:flagellar biosynthetic protein FliQ
MNPVMAAALLRDAVSIALSTAAPLLITALAIGLIVSLIQAVTQVQEQSLTFIPKLAAVGLLFIVLLPWMIRGLVEFTVRMLQSMPAAAQ